MMTKFLSLMLSLSLCMGLLAGCRLGGGESSSSSSAAPSSSGSSAASGALREGMTLKDVVKKVNDAFGEDGAVMMATPLEEAMLPDQYDIPLEDVEEFYGEFSMSMTNSDHLIAIKAKPGKIDVVRRGLEKRKADLISQYERYPVNGSFERAKAAKVYIRGDYGFLIAVGVLPDDMDAAPDFESQIQKAQDVIDQQFA